MAAAGADLDNEVQNWWYYNASVECMNVVTNGSTGGGLKTGLSDVKSGDWFTTSLFANTGGYYMKNAMSAMGSDGGDGCSQGNSQVLSQALSLWKISPVTAACNSGIYVRSDGSNCLNSNTTADFSLSSKATSSQTGNLWKSYIQKTVFSGSAPALSDADKYQFFYQTFVNGCQPGSAQTSASAVQSSGEAINSASANNYGYEIATVSGSGTDATMTKTYYSAKQSGDTNVNTYPASWSHPSFGTANATQETCAYLAKQIADPAGTLAQAYLTAVQTGTKATNPGGNTSSSSDSSAPTCDPSIGMGWIVCVVAQFTGTLIDGMYNIVIANLLMEPPIDVNDANSGEVRTWQIFLTIANVAFVIVFLFMIYAHLTTTAVDKYGLKRMLPRMIIAAILVNSSLYICAAGVDLSNVLGTSIFALLSHIGGIGSTSNIDAWASIVAFLMSGAAIGGTVAIGGAAIALGAAVMSPEIAIALLGILLPLLLGGLLAIFILVFILIARHALIFMLVVLSPLAFVAYILPNTQSWFTKWRQWFVSLLVLYPVVSFMFGASQIAGMLMITSSGNSLTSSNAIGGAIAIMSGLFMMVAPFFFLPFMIRRFGGANLEQLAGSVTNKLRGMTNPLARMGAGAGKNAMGRHFNRLQAGQGRGANSILGRGAQRWSQYKARRKLESDHYGREQEDAIMERLRDDEGYRLAAAGGNATAAALLAVRADEHKDKRWDEEVTRQQKSMTSTHPSALLDVVKDQSVSAERRAAAAGMIMDRGSMNDIHRLLDASQQLGDDPAASGIRKQMMHDMNRTPFGLGSGDIAALKRGEATYDYDEDGNRVGGPVDYAHRLETRAQEKLSGAKWAGMDPDDQKAITELALKGGLSKKSLQNLVDATTEAEGSPNISVDTGTKDLGAKLREYAQGQGVAPTSQPGTPSGPAIPPRTTPSTVDPAARTTPTVPHLRGGEDPTESGFIVPRDMK